MKDTPLYFVVACGVSSGTIMVTKILVIIGSGNDLLPLWSQVSGADMNQWSG